MPRAIATGDRIGESVGRAPQRQKHQVMGDEISLPRNSREGLEVKRNSDEVRREKFFRPDKVALRDVCVRG
jgi:hypothetical protein